MKLKLLCYYLFFLLISLIISCRFREGAAEDVELYLKGHSFVIKTMIESADISYKGEIAIKWDFENGKFYSSTKEEFTSPQIEKKLKELRGEKESILQLSPDMIDAKEKKSQLERIELLLSYTNKHIFEVYDFGDISYSYFMGKWRKIYKSKKSQEEKKESLKKIKELLEKKIKEGIATAKAGSCSSEDIKGVTRLITEEGDYFIAESKFTDLDEAIRRVQLEMIGSILARVIETDININFDKRIKEILFFTSKNWFSKRDCQLRKIYMVGDFILNVEAKPEIFEGKEKIIVSYEHTGVFDYIQPVIELPEEALNAKEISEKEQGELESALPEQNLQEELWRR